MVCGVVTVCECAYSATRTYTHALARALFNAVFGAAVAIVAVAVADAHSNLIGQFHYSLTHCI